MKNTKKLVALLLAMMLLLGGVIGGTVAYLIHTTGTVQNTFASSDVSITLTETKPDGKTAKMVPGKVIEKNPVVTVIGGSEKCYLFVKVEESANFKEFMSYGIAAGWSELKDGETPVTGVYYRVVESATGNQEFPILTNNEVKVLDTVTKDKMAEAKNANPTLTFAAYAIQFDYLEDVSDANDAWELIDK